MKEKYLIFVLILFPLLNLPLILNSQTLICEDLIVNSNQFILISENKKICNFIIKGEAQVKILNSTVEILDNFKIDNLGTLIIENSNLTIYPNIFLFKNSKLITKNSTLNFYNDYPFKQTFLITDNSAFYSTKTRIISNYLFIESRLSSKLNLNLTIFKGEIILYPLSYSNVTISNSEGFRVYLTNQRFNIEISNSEFSISLEILTKPVSLKLPSGKYSYWDLSYISEDYLGIPGIIKVYNSFISGTKESYSEVIFYGNIDAKIYHSKNLKIKLINIPTKASQLNIGYYKRITFNLQNVSKIELINSTILEWILQLESPQKYILTNSSGISLFTKNNAEVELVYVKNIKKIVGMNSSKITLLESSIKGFIHLFSNSKMFLRNTEIEDLNKFKVFENSTVYISSLTFIDVIFDEEKINVNLDIKGTVAIISNKTEIKMKTFILEIGIKTKFIKFIKIIQGFSNKHGILSSYFGEKLPRGIYVIKLTLISTDGTVLETNRTVVINSNVKITPPSKPELSIEVSRYPTLSWNVKEENPFIPIEGYKVYRANTLEDLELFIKVGKYYRILPADKNFFIDTETESGKRYLYAVTAYNTIGESEPSRFALADIPQINEKKLYEIIYQWMAGLGILSIFFIILSYLVKSAKGRKIKLT